MRRHSPVGVLPVQPCPVVLVLMVLLELLAPGGGATCETRGAAEVEAKHSSYNVEIAKKLKILKSENVKNRSQECPGVFLCRTVWPIDFRFGFLSGNPFWKYLLF